MEAATNEFCNDCCDSAKDVTNTLGKQQTALVAQRWKATQKDRRRWPILDHFQDALKILKIPLFQRGNGIFQTARVLVDLRNFLVHYGRGLRTVEVFRASCADWRRSSARSVSRLSSYGLRDRGLTARV